LVPHINHDDRGFGCDKLLSDLRWHTRAWIVLLEVKIKKCLV
jgi:hypothetical protein